MTKKRGSKSNPKPRMLMVIDGSNLAFRAFKKFERFKTPNGIKTGMIYGFLKVLHSYINRFKPGYIIVSFDTKQCKSSNFRNEILENYKGHRKRIDFDYVSFNKQIRAIKRILGHLGIPVIWDNKGLGFESDDYIAWATLKHKGKVLIVSADKDFSQLIDDRVKMYNPSKECYITTQNCKELLGWNPGECVDFLSLLGDTSDSIPGYKGMGPVKIRQFLDEHTSIYNFLSNTQSEFKGIDRDGLELLAEKNYQLISLHRSVTLIGGRKVKIPIIYPKKTKLDKRKLNRIFKHYSLMSFMIDEFTNTFKNRKTWTI